jgi:hypothetical protein
MQPPYLRQTELGEGEPAAVPERCLRWIGGEQRTRGKSLPQGPLISGVIHCDLSQESTTQGQGLSGVQVDRFVFWG